MVSDLRKEFKAPNMPVVVGELGNGGPVTEGAMFEFRKAQEEGTKQIKNALFIKTTDFARPPELSPCPGMDITGSPMRRVTFLSAKRPARA